MPLINDIKRIITHYPDDNSSYQLQIGPFLKEDINDFLEELDEDEDGATTPKWTIVINDVDRFYPPLADWMHSRFSFIPTWRRDDAQFSLSQAGGGIGPHVDNYDVFLIQTNGQREWKVGNQMMSIQEEMERNIPELDVRILRESIDSSSYDELSWEDFILNPGDCLYLPPRIPHQGIALVDNSITLSVGCRAPSGVEMISRIAENMSMSLAGKAIQRYEDMDLLDHMKESAEITKGAKERAKQIVRDAISDLIEDDDAWDQWFGSFVSESKRVRTGYPIELTSMNGNENGEDSDHEEWIESLGVWGNAKDAVASILRGDGALYQAEGITFCYSRCENSQCSCRLFVNGSAWCLQNNCFFVDIIANNRRITKETFDGKFVCDETIQLLEDLVEQGLLYGMNE